MRFWIDTEFNGFEGDLISLALVAESGEMFYIVRNALDTMEVDPWVQENVIPHLGKNPEGFNIEWSDDITSKHILERYLKQFDGEIEIISDWPEDVAHFCKFMITGPGYMINTVNRMTFAIDRTLDVESEVPHNALYDAMANMEATLTREIENNRITWSENE